MDQLSALFYRRFREAWWIVAIVHDNAYPSTRSMYTEAIQSSYLTLARSYIDTQVASHGVTWKQTPVWESPFPL